MDREILYKLFDGSASEAEKELIQAWLKEDPGHTKEFFKEREFFDAILISENHQLISAQKVKKVSSFHLHPVFRELIKVAVVVALVLAVGSHFYTDKMNELAGTVNKIIVPSGQRVNLVLPDGTNVWLNARSEMKYPSVFKDSHREVELNGEAYFEVTCKESQPFIVHTLQCDVEVLGTKFNVEAYDESDIFSTALLEGSVKLVNRKDPMETLLLKPHYVANLYKGSLSASPIVDYDPYCWREGLICFHNTNFMELMYRFEKSYGIRIVVENPALADHVFSGKFRISDGIDNALRVLQREANYTFTRNKDESIIYIK